MLGIVESMKKCTVLFLSLRGLHLKPQEFWSRAETLSQANGSKEELRLWMGMGGESLNIGFRGMG